MLNRFFLFMVILLSGGQAMAAGGFRTLEPAAPPALSLRDLSGNVQDLEKYQDKVILVNFWASWCPPCRREMPSMQRLKERMADRPFVILGIDSGEQLDEVMSFLGLVKVDFPIMLDSDVVVTKRWKVFALPTSFLIDRQGRVRYAISGPTEWDEGEALQLIESLLK